MTTAPFNDPAAIARYAEGPTRNVSSYSSLLAVSRILLAERVPAQGRVLVLVVGADGGLELEEFAKNHSGWSFDGVDPSAAMLDLAARRLASEAPRVTLHQGYIQDAPAGPFDGATCLLTSHFVPEAQRLPMAVEIRQRLKPGSPYVSAHLSLPSDAAARELWMSRYAAFLMASGVAAQQAQAARLKILQELPILSPEQDEAILYQAGFSQVQLFYVGFAFRGWLAYA